MGVETAIMGGSALLGAGTTLMAGEKAADVSAAGTAAAIDMQWQMYQQQRADFAPWREAGVWALGKPSGYAKGPQTITTPSLPAYPYPTGQESADDKMMRTNAWLDEIARAKARGYGTTTVIPGEINPLTGQPYAPGEYMPGTGLQGMVERGPGEFIPEEQPGYKFGYEEFVKKPIERGASRAGRSLAPSTQKALTRYAGDYAELSYQNFLDRYYQSLNPYFSIAGLAMPAVQGSAAAAGQVGANVANLGYTNALNQANIATGTAAGVAGVGQSAFQNYLNYNVLKGLGLMGGGSTGAAGGSSVPTYSSQNPNWYAGWQHG